MSLLLRRFYLSFENLIEMIRKNGMSLLLRRFSLFGCAQHRRVSSVPRCRCQSVSLNRCARCRRVSSVHSVSCVRGRWVFAVAGCSRSLGVRGRLVFAVSWCSRSLGVRGRLVFAVAWCSRSFGVQKFKNKKKKEQVQSIYRV
jgi:hypothetical protein